MNQYGIVIVSRVSAIAEGIKQLIEQVATHVPITIAGGIEDNGVGTSMENVQEAIEKNSAKELLIFYDLGSAKMNAELCAELTEKKYIYFMYLL